MPIKTEFLGLDKLQTNEYYSSDTENTNLDKIDDKLKDHEERTSEIENKISKKEQLSVELSPTKRGVLVRDSFSGVCGYEVKGDLVEQLNLNGNFDNGVDNISFHGLQGTIIENRMLLQSTSIIMQNPYIRFTGVKQKFIAGEKYFMYCKVKPKLIGTSLVAVGLAVSDTHNPAGHFSESLYLNQWNEMYDVITVDGQRNGQIEPYIQLYVTTGNKIEDVIEIDKNTGVIVIKLQKCDLELSREQLKAKYVDCGYFEGIQALRGVSIKSSGKNFARSINSSFKNWGNIDYDYYSIQDDFYKCLPQTNGLTKGYISVKHNGKGKYTLSANVYTSSSSGSRTITLVTLNVPAEEFVDSSNYVESIVLNVSGNTNPTRLSKSADFTEDFVDMVVYCISQDGEIYFKDIQVEEGLVHTEYESYIDSVTVISDSLAKLSNGSIDKVVCRNGEYYKSIETNIGRDIDFYMPNSDEILFSPAINVNYVLILKPKDFIGYNSGYIKYDSAMVVEGFGTVNGVYDDVSNIGNAGSSGSLFSFVLVVDKTKCPDEETAKSMFAGKLKIAYQLKTPLIEKCNIFKAIEAYDNRTQFHISDGFIENERAKVTTSGAHDEYFIGIYGHEIVPNSNTHFKVRKIEDIVCNDRSIMSLGRVRTSNLTYGSERWSIGKEIAEIHNLDINEVYISYITSESNGQTNATIMYNADVSTAISSNIEMINNIGEQVDRNTSKVDRLNKRLEWIEPTLLNGVESLPNLPIAYAKDAQGWVYLSGGSNGTGVLGEAHFRLPEGYRPKGTLSFVVHSNNSTRGVIQISSSGHVFQVSGATNACRYHQVSFFVGE